MDDKFARQYDYKANSNLVLQNDNSLVDRRPNNEATGEVQSLVGMITGHMGDRVTSSSIAVKKGEEQRRLQNEMKKRKRDVPSKLKQELNEIKGSFSVADIEIKDLLYQPKSDLTAAAYGLIVKFVRKQIGFQHNSIINGAADEVIATMKDPNLDEGTRRSEIDKLLSSEGSLNDDDYHELCNLAKKLNDWDGNQTKVKEDTAEEEAGGIGVILSDDEDAMSDDYLSEVKDSDDEFDLEDMFEKAATASEALNLEELAKRHANIVPKVEIGEPIRREGFQEYHIEPKNPSQQRRDNLIKIEDLSEGERKAFGDFKSLNLIQSIIYKKAMTTDKSLLICAPTGAGKTNIALLTMLREILKHPKKDGHGYDTSKFKIIYVAPIKALVQEMVENFKKRLSCDPYNLNVEELTGDHQLDQRQISKAQIIVCTPEKWDIVTRKSLDRLYTKIVRLVIFDEIHLLHNERGATLESLVARIKRHKQIEGEPIRIIGLSATLPNYKDVSRFIAPEESEEQSTFYFDGSYRPIPLRQQYIAMTESKKGLKIINDIVYEKVVERLVKHAQILIFVHSRPDTVKTAEYLKTKALDAQKIGLFLSSESAVDMINEYGKDLNPKIRELLQFGIGVHHAGLSKHDRSCVEELFRGKYVKVLVSTATLAWGVNLPARTVIIKGTQVYREGRWTDLDSLDVTQMLGRAGRPGFDKEGEGIVITQQSQVAFYVSLMTEQLPVESRLIGRLPEFINSECVIGNIESLEDAVNWISETYLSSRMISVMEQGNRQYMALYGITDSIKRDDPKLASHKHNLAYTALSILDDRGLIVFDRNSGAIKSTEVGRIASNYNCSSRTIKMFYDSIHENTSDIELLRTFSLADEFKDIFVRKGEEADLMTLLNQVPFPIDDKRATPGSNKVNALLQVYIFRMNIEGSDLICDMHFIKDNAARLVRAIHEIVLLKKYALVAELAFDLCRKIDKRMTECHSPLRQFPNDLDLDIIGRLERKNYHVEELKVLKADRLSELLRCDRHVGEKIYKLLRYLPKLKIEASIKPMSKTSLKIELSIQQDFSWHEKHHGYSQRFWLHVEDVNQEALLHHEIIHLRKYNASETNKIIFFVPYLIPRHPFYFIRILPDNWFGCDHHLPLYLDKLTLPDETFLSTPLHDLELQSLKSLENRDFERIYEDKFKGASFNQIQTQAFPYLYQSDEDVILLAAAGSGKATCAELAILRNINKNGASAKTGYIAGNAQAARVIYDCWSKIFGRSYGTLLLTGNHRFDVPRVDNPETNIIIGDPQTWHVLTLIRSRKYRKLLSKFQLFIIDDIHLLHNQNGSIIEWVCAKLRILTKLNSTNPARIVTLGSPMLGAESLKSWLALERSVKEPVLLNYPLSIRPVEMELIVQKFHHYDYNMRLMTMQRPVYRNITNIARDRSVIIYVSDYYQSIDLIENLISYSKGERVRFVGPHKISSKLYDTDLKRYLNYGIALLHKGSHSSDKKFIEEEFESNQIQILIVTASICWSLKSRSYLTIVMDTQYHDGIRSSDYELTDIMRMVGSTGRPWTDHECKCIIMCQSSKAGNYERFLREPLPIESDIPVNLISLVNYEIATNSIAQLNDIYKPYLAHTYFYKRISINPNYYGIVVPEDAEQKAKVFGSFFNNLVNKVALDLQKSEFISMEGSHENPDFSPGLLSKISLEYYINYETLETYSRHLSDDSLHLRTLELIELISNHTHEFRCIPIRSGELQTLKALQRRHRPREPDQLNNANFKVKLLLLSFYQKTDGKEDYLEGDLVEDRLYIVNFSHRLLMAIVDIAWLRDSFSLAKTCIQLSKKLVPFYRDNRPNLDMDIGLSKEEDQVIIDVNITRDNDPFDYEEFQREYSLSRTMYREEGWCFLVLGHSRSDGAEKFLLFKRVKTPNKGPNQYKLELNLQDASSYQCDLYFMSDFYSTSEDRRVAMDAL